MNLNNTLTKLSLKAETNLHTVFNHSKIACVDLETTGLSPTTDRIIEVGIVLLHNGKLTEHQWLIHPQQRVTSFIHSFTGISSEDLRDAKTFVEVAPDIHSILDDALFIAHNATFDYSFLYHAFRRVQIDFSPRTVCTVHLARKIIPGLRSYNLDSVLAGLQIPAFDRHRALPDAQAVYEIIKKAKNL